ncbi:unnamed protein product [Menidia menidia]|uniref:(Atlantic silverside) hypothetical protein n=1 Tax=Menidia menidia TaxID=238744 RepID=A0A8S4BBH8_9TELE|nr:unnamed protein product [Menidia menidia]
MSSWTPSSSENTSRFDGAASSSEAVGRKHPLDCNLTGQEEPSPAPYGTGKQVSMARAALLSHSTCSSRDMPTSQGLFCSKRVKMRPAQIQNKAALLNKPLVKENKPRRVTPSAFTQEMLQSTEERLSNTVEVQPPRILELLPMNGPPHQRITTVDMGRPLFQPYPSELVFQNFFPSQTYKLPLLLVNKDKISRHVKLEHLDSEQFYVEGPQEAGSKVAPGMSATFTVLFKPQENKDYSHRVVCVTERERFEIPIRAIGPRAILDFRDEVLLPACPVKGSTQKTHLVRNVGNSQAKFRLQTQRPFSVTPASGTLDVGHSMQVTVDFHPTTVGDHQQDLLLHYDTDEDVYISLSGSCEELNIQLKPDSLTLRNTYIGLANARTVSLTNESDIPLQYCWRMCPCLQEEDLSSSGESSAIRQSCEEDEGRGLSQCRSDHTAMHHLPPQQGDRSQAAGDPPMAFSLGCLTVEPAEGEIWPNARAQFTIIFKPAENKHYHQIMYCDITGREKPLPLTIKGEGLGPELQLDFNLMEMKNVFMGYKDCYEVQLSNTGLIDAPFRFSRPNTTFGRYFSFRPGEGVVPPGACQIVEVTFQSRILGTFSEDLLLTVTGQPQPLTLTFRGCVIAPTFHFDIHELNFGDVAFGFPVTSTFTLLNTSFVPMTFALRVRGDGFGSASVTSADQVSDLSRKNWQGQAHRDRHARPVEFTVSPATGSVRAMSEVIIKVTLCSNTVWRYRAVLVVDVEGVGEEIMSLPISARCVVPEVTVEPLVLDFQRCFLRHPYEQKVCLSNPSTLPACYGLLDQENQESSSVLFGSSVPRGVLLPGSSVELPVLLVAKAVGRLHHTLRIAVFGSLQQPLEVMLSCIGQGPVVHIQRTELQFGTVPVLTDITRTLHLSNQSPIPAPFNARTSQRRSFWRVEPNDGEVPPGSQLELTVVAHLKDTLPVQDRLEVSILDSQTHSVSLSATGTGTTIVSDRPFGPSLDLGTHFSHGLCQYRFKLTNQGQRVHRMFWKINGSLSSTKKCKEGSFPNKTFLPPITTPRKKDMPSQGSSLPSSRDKQVFNLSPSRVELFPGSSVDMVLTVSADSPKTVRQQLVCHGIIGQKGCQETIMSVDVTCRFVAPMLSISSKKLNFAIKKVLEIHYLGHPQQDNVELHAEVHFPNLHFSSTNVDFGCVFNCTESHEVITISNCSPLPVSYHWTFVDNQKHSDVSPGPNADAQSCTPRPLCVEEVFDILPIYGHLQPGDQQLLTFSFFGHENVSREVVAQCHVEEGPTYDIKLKGEASEISYSLKSAHLDFGVQGYIDAGSQQCLRVLYLPGFPEVFQKVLQLQVAFLPPQEITLTGVGVFPRIGLNLPRTLSEESYGDVLHQAKAAVEAERLRQELTNDGGATDSANCTLTYEELLHMEVERLLVKENALSVFGSLLEQRDVHGSPTQWSKLSNFELPEYVLDFGSVTPGRVDGVTVKVINNGSIPVSFHANCKRLTGTGFTAEFEKVKNLPCGETQTFAVKLDPRGAELKRGDTSVLFPIQVAGGPAVQVRLRAVFTVPAITVSEERLQFDTVQCGMCQIKTMQLQNNELVPCHWSIAEEVKPVKKGEKLLHLYKHKKVLQGEQRVVFEVVPCSGLLSPLERVCVQIKFSPAKGGVYNRRLEVRVADSPQQAFITAQGHGEEPQLEFCPSVLELGPLLPLSIEGEAEVTVRNPCPFPIEFYSLEFDTQYQKEEKILRLMPGYDEKNTLLLPPRVPGEGLPPELLEYFENYSSQLRDDEGNVAQEGDEPRKHYTQEDIQAEISTRTEISIARHMGFDLSPEGLAARNRRGIAVIVYGAPLTETRRTAAALASHYGAACLNVDAVATEVLRNGTSAVSLSARQLYEAAAEECAQQKAAEAEALQKERADREERWLQEMDEDQYEALPLEEKERITQHHLESLRQLKLRHPSAATPKIRSRTRKNCEIQVRLSANCIVDDLLCQFTEYEQNHAHVEHILQYWDRAQGLLLVPLNSEETLQSEDTPTEKQIPVVKKTKKGKTTSPQPTHTRASAEPDHKAEEKMPSSDIIPHIVLDVTEKDCGGVTELLSNGPLPPVDDLLEDLGLAPGGPQIPPSTTFSVVPFPTLREAAKTPESCFTLLIPSGGDDDEDKKGSEEETTESLGKEDGLTTASKSQSRGSNKESSSQKDKDKKAKESLKSKKKASGKTKVKRQNGPNAVSQASSADQDQQQTSLEMKVSQRQDVPSAKHLEPNGEVVLRVWFYSESLGTFEQALNFELVGTRRLYQLPCRGICTYPSICKDYTTVFAHSKWVQHMKNGLQKAFVISAGHFEFGPLLCSKSRDRYKESRYPENAEKLVIRNNSDLEAEVHFSFQHDTQASTYLLDPPTLTLKPGQKKELTVWAYPTKQGQIKDCIVCHIRDNPEPVIIKLSCWGVRPELELDNKHLHFGRILLHSPLSLIPLHRRDSRSVMMRNKTALPVSWRLQGVEELGEEFVVPIDEDTIPPHSSFLFSIHFRPRRTLNIKKILRLEVSDAEKIVGTVQTENIQVIAEAYDIDLEITPDSILDFGILSVYSEVKLPVKLKNKGKYEIAYRFTITPAYDLNFGPMAFGCKRSLNLTIENSGVFEMHFSISHMITELG